MRTQDVETYFIDGCGRCALGGTPECKVHQWAAELQLLRHIIVSCGLAEECKWGVPVYTLNQKNVIMIGAFKTNCTISFIKGSLLADEHKILEKAGENSQEGRVLRFTNTKQITSIECILRAYIFEAIEVEKAGLKTESKKITTDDFPEELTNKLNENKAFNNAFLALTPGKQRGYLIHFNQAKQSKTREQRIEKYIPHILKGKGFHDV